MAKGERKRRRRAGEESAGLEDDSFITAESSPTEAFTLSAPAELPLPQSGAQDVLAASPSGEEKSALRSIPTNASRQARKLQMRSIGVPAALETPLAAEDASGVGPAAAEKPVALAQILSNPSFAARAKPVPQFEAAAEPAEPEASTPSGPDLRANDILPAETTVEESEPPSQAAYPPLHSYRLEPEDEPKRWTREPMLVALLLVALIMLAFNTYSTLRMNGIADRLSAIGAQSTPAAGVGLERPWVGVDTIRTQAFASGGQPVTTVHIVNSGREPAYDLRSNTVGSLRSSATPAPEIPAQKGPLATTGLLLPNTGGNLTFFGNTRALTAEEAASVRSGQYVLWLAGRLDYKDSKGRPHATTFRYRYDPNLNSFVAAPAGNVAN